MKDFGFVLEDFSKIIFLHDEIFEFSFFFFFFALRCLTMWLTSFPPQREPIIIAYEI